MKTSDILLIVFLICTSVDLLLLILHYMFGNKLIYNSTFSLAIFCTYFIVKAIELKK
jgi:hypothetical protein